MTTTHDAVAATIPGALRQALLATWCRRALYACFVASLALVYLSTSQQGLWEDGYFVKRFAYNFWHHGSFSWNVDDGPVYGMTSQTLQVIGALVYVLAPQHLVLGLKLVLYAALVATLLVLSKSVRHAARDDSSSAAAALDPAAGVMLCAVGLSVSLIVQVVLMGLETALALLMVALAILAIQRSHGTRGGSLKIVLATLGVYVTRPDAVLIPGVLLAAQWLLAWREQRSAASVSTSLRLLTATLIAIAVGLGALLGLFYLYYGTPLPLPFYIKTHGLSTQSAAHIQTFALEKLKNALGAAFFALPFLFVAAHARVRFVALLVASALVFCGYHYFATIETMGYLSRFYLPGLVPIFAAAGIAYRDYLVRRRWLVTGVAYATWIGAFLWLKSLDEAMRIPHLLERSLEMPVLVATGVLLFAPRRWLEPSAALVGLCLLVGSACVYPLPELALLDDETMLLAQIRPRVVFRGLEQLRSKLEPKAVFHTDMGAPGVLLPEARVVDLDGLLNEDITLRGASFNALCEKDQPEAIFVPNSTYPELREEVLSSPCLERYRAVTPMNGSPLYIREDRAEAYLANGAPDG